MNATRTVRQVRSDREAVAMFPLSFTKRSLVELVLMIAACIVAWLLVRN